MDADATWRPASVAAHRFSCYDEPRLRLQPAVRLAEPPRSKIGGSRPGRAVLRAATLAVAVVAAAAAIPGCQAGEDESSVDNLIEFSSFRKGIPGIFTVAVDNGTVRRVASHTALDAAWSPDGRKLAYFRSQREEADLELYVMDADGTKKRRLTQFSGAVGDAAWRPDGKAIAFDRCTDESCAIAVIAPDGSGLRRVGPRGTDGEPVWSPNGRFIAFEPTASGRLGIFILDVHTRRLRRLTSKDDSDPRWSPDGTAIAFTRMTPLPHRDARMDIYVVRANGRGLHRLTKGPLKKSLNPAWSPDGKLIAFDGLLERRSLCHGTSGATAIYVISPQGTTPQRLTPYRPMFDSPTWSPDGTRIAYASLTCRGWNAEEPSEWPLWVMNADGSRPRRLGPRAHTDFEFAWQPAPRR
jgi:Tol biopolymer transport system component